MACRRTDEPLEDHLRGKLLEHLKKLARSYLKYRVSEDLVDGGREVIEEVIAIMIAAILTPSAADGTGFGAAFYTKLNQRLVDRIRASRKDLAIIEQEAVDPETGATFEAPDLQQLSPEENVMVNNILAQLPDNYRKAFLLYRNGFKYTSSDPNESIAVMLGKTPKTVQSWVEKAALQIRELLRETKK